jgi:membrane protease YdiL (CAAX protease family)
MVSIYKQPQIELIIERLKALSVFKFVLCFIIIQVLAILLIGFPIGFLLSHVFHFSEIDRFKEVSNRFSLFDRLMIGLVVAPIAETFIFQYLPFKFIEKFKKEWLVIFISSLFFGLAHAYSIKYRINAFLLGVTLNLAYSIWRKKNSKIHPYVTVSLLHFFRNTIAIVIATFCL